MVCICLLQVKCFSIHYYFLGVRHQLVGSQELPFELDALNYFKAIVPFAFKQIQSISSTSTVIDELLADLLTGIDNKDKLAQLAGIRFENYLASNMRVCVFK